MARHRKRRDNFLRLDVLFEASARRAIEHLEKQGGITAGRLNRLLAPSIKQGARELRRINPSEKTKALIGELLDEITAQLAKRGKGAAHVGAR